MKRSKTPTIAPARAKPAKRKALSPAKPAHIKSGAKSSRDRVRSYRRRMRVRGLRLVLMWLPDTRTPEFVAQAHRASLAIANSPTERQDQSFVDSVQWWTSPEADASAQTEPDVWWKERSD